MKEKINLDDPNYSSSSSARVVVQDHKVKVLWVILGVIAVIVIAIAIVMQNGIGGDKGLDPNRTREPCSLYGEAPVYGSQHDTTYCFPDGDGYYSVNFGHHHHK